MCMISRGNFTSEIMLQWLEEDFLGYLKEWEESVSVRAGFTAKEKKNMLLSQETLLGIAVTGKAVLIMSDIYGILIYMFVIFLQFDLLLK